jgi:hypothetical protein
MVGGEQLVELVVQRAGSLGYRHELRHACEVSPLVRGPLEPIGEVGGDVVGAQIRISVVSVVDSRPQH